MSTLYTHQDSNKRRTLFLFAAFLVLVIGIGLVFAEVYGDPLILYAAVGISFVMQFVSYWFSDKVALSLSRAVPAERADHPELYRIVENLSITAGLPMPALHIIDDPAPNAFATGRDPEHASVAVTTGLLATLSRNELEGVLAHELSHVGNRDILVSTVAVVLAGCISIAADFFLRSLWWGGSDRRERSNGALMILGVALAILAPIFGSLLQLVISRKREYLADASGVLLTRYPEGLASALEKISSYKAPLATASHATAHLFISNPFGDSKFSLAALFSTHPPIEERIKILRSLH